MYSAVLNGIFPTDRSTGNRILERIGANGRRLAGVFSRSEPRKAIRLNPFAEVLNRDVMLDLVPSVSVPDASSLSSPDAVFSPESHVTAFRQEIFELQFSCCNNMY